MFNSSVPTYLSLATLASILLIILRVVSTPTSDATKISSKLSKTSSSTLDLPATAFDNLSKKLDFDFSKPLSKNFFFFFGKYLFKKTHLYLCYF